MKDAAEVSIKILCEAIAHQLWGGPFVCRRLDWVLESIYGLGIKKRVFCAKHRSHWAVAPNRCWAFSFIPSTVRVLKEETMKIYPTLMLVALMLSGCAATPAPVQGYRPANHSGPPWEISGSYNKFSE